MNYAADWAAEWGMLFNAEKSEHLALSTRKPDITSPHVTMNGTQIPQAENERNWKDAELGNGALYTNMLKKLTTTLLAQYQRWVVEHFVTGTFCYRSPWRRFFAG